MNASLVNGRGGPEGDGDPGRKSLPYLLEQETEDIRARDKSTWCRRKHIDQYCVTVFAWTQSKNVKRI